MRAGRERGGYAKQQPVTSVEEAAERMLQARGTVDASSLVALIHEVNPSGRELPPNVERRRYALKARLQSLLIRHHRPKVRVELVAGVEGVVGLRWGLEGRDACHAVVSELDEDARSWVRLKLDLGDAIAPGANNAGLASSAPRARESRRDRRSASRRAEASADTSLGGAELGTLLHLGREAQAQYDFDEARRHFAEALERSEGGLDAARALLELLVDQLAAFDDALELDEALSSEARAHPDVRCRLALAAAHLGRQEPALAFLQGLDDRRAADSLTVLARSALGAGDLARAEEWLARARTLDALHPDVTGLLDELSRARAARRRPAEEELERTAAAGDDARTAEQAHALLAHWPDSATARRVLREVEARARQLEARTLVAQAEAALSRQDFAAAAGLFRKAESLGDTRAAPRALEAERRQAQQLESLQVEQVLRALSDEPATGAGVSEENLLAYFALADALRATVRARLSSPELSWLEELRPYVSDHQAKAAIAAVLALARAAAAPAEEPEVILELLAPHERLLQKLRRARELAAAAGATLESRKRQQAAEREEMERRAAEAAAREEARRRMVRFDECAASGAWLEALELTHQALADEAASAERDVWTARQARAMQGATATLCVEVADGKDAPAWELHRLLRVSQGAMPLLHPSGERIYLVAAIDRWLFIYVYEVFNDGDLLQVVSCRTPERLGFSAALVDEDSLWVAGEHGAALTLSLDTWQVRRFRPGISPPVADEEATGALLAPGGRFLWLAKKNEHTSSLRLLDLSRGRLHRELGEDVDCSLVAMEPESKVLVSSAKKESRLHGLHGAPAGALPAGLEVDQLALHPSGEGYVGLIADGGDTPVCFVEETSAGGAWAAPLAIEGSASEAPHALATSAESRCCYVLCRRDKKHDRLLGFRGQRDAVEQFFDVVIPSGSRLVQDFRGRRVACLAAAERGFVAIALGDTTPDMPTFLKRDEDSAGEEAPPTAEASPCMTLRDLPMAMACARAIFMERSTEKRAGLVIGALAEHEEEVDWLWLFSLYLEKYGLTLERTFVRNFIDEHHARDALAELYRANEMLDERRWEDALSRLSGIRLEDLAEEQRPHVYHTKGLALFHLTRYAEALEAFQAVETAGQGRCRVDYWIWVISDALEKPRSGKGILRWLLDHLQKVDERLAQGDATGAYTQADDPRIWFACEIQCLARLAAAYLAGEEAEPRFRFRKRLMLAVFCGALGQDDWIRSPSLPFPMAWDKDRLGQLAAQARRWLDGESH